MESSNKAHLDLGKTQEWIPEEDSSDVSRLLDRLQGSAHRLAAAAVEHPNALLRSGDGSLMVLSTVLKDNGPTRVRIVLHEAFDRPLVGKFFVSSLSLTGMVQRFRNEAEFLSMLGGSCHVPSLRGLGEVDGRPYLLMDFQPGVSLASVMDVAGGRSFPKHIVKQVGAESAFALAQVHQAGVVHRDVKPGNMILRDDGRLMLIDFGLACRRRGEELRITDHGQIMGTPRYLAPESVGGSRSATPAADVYALGLVLYELFTGKHPLSDDQIGRLYRGELSLQEHAAIAEGIQKHVADHDASLGLLLNRVLNSDPDSRPTAAQILEQLSGMAVEKYRKSGKGVQVCAPKHPRGVHPIPSAFGASEEEAAHALFEAMRKTPRIASRRAFLLSLCAAGVATAVLGILSRKGDEERPPLSLIGKSEEDGVALSSREGEAKVWVVRMRGEENELMCTLFSHHGKTVLFVPGSGLTPLTAMTEEEVTAFIREFPEMDGPVRIPKGFPGDVQSWRSTVQGRLRVLREQASVRE